MRWFGPSAVVEMVDRKDGLQIQVSGLRRWIDLVVAGSVLAVMAIVAWRDGSWFFLVVLLGGTIYSFIRWLDDHESQLWVTDEELEAVGDLGGSSYDHVRLRWSSISGLEYRVGGEDEPSGLYARLGGRSVTRIMALVNKKQAEEIIAAIYARFPYVEMADDDGGWLPLGGKSELTTLGLSRPKE
jgi:hypothetical protein